MKKRTTFRESLIGGAIGAVLGLSMIPSTVIGAQATTTVEIDFPQVLVLYTYDTIKLNVSAAGIADALSATACSGDYCTSAGAEKDLSGSALALDGSDSVDADISGGTIPSLSTASITVTNAFGARALGYSGYSASVSDGGNTDAIGNPSVTAPAYSGLSLSTGNLTFDIDLSNVTNTTESEDFLITVTGT